MRRRRKYRNSLGSVETALRAAYTNAHDLVAASKALITTEHYAPALALSVLALEELGKLLVIDGLLFARSDDYKAMTFHKSGKSHNLKLRAFALFPIFIHNISTQNPLYLSENKQTFVIAINDWNRRYNLLCDKLKIKSLTELDLIKQNALYSSEKDGVFVAPCNMIDRDLADAIWHLAWRAVDTVEFLFSDKGLQFYLDSARAVRNKASEEDHREFEGLGEEFAADIFGVDADTHPEKMH